MLLCSQWHVVWIFLMGQIKEKFGHSHLHFGSLSIDISNDLVKFPG